MVESLPDPYFILSPIHDDAGAIVDFRYDYANATGELLAGAQIVPGHALSEFDPGITETPRFEAYRRVMATGEPSTRSRRWSRPLEHRAGRCSGGCSS